MRERDGGDSSGFWTTTRTLSGLDWLAALLAAAVVFWSGFEVRPKFDAYLRYRAESEFKATPTPPFEEIVSGTRKPLSRERREALWRAYTGQIDVYREDRD